MHISADRMSSWAFRTAIDDLALGAKTLDLTGLVYMLRNMSRSSPWLSPHSNSELPYRWSVSAGGYHSVAMTKS